MNTLEIATMLGEHHADVVLEVPDLDAARHVYAVLLELSVEARRKHRTVYNRVADGPVVRAIELARDLLQDNVEHVAACRRA